MLQVMYSLLYLSRISLSLGNVLQETLLLFGLKQFKDRHFKLRVTSLDSMDFIENFGEIV